MLHQVTFFGISYRGDVGDTRYTPVEILVKKVTEAGAYVNLHDPYVSFWEEQACNVETSIEKVLEVSPNLIIMSTGHSEYKNLEFVHRLLELNTTNIYDTIGLFNDEQLTLLKSKHKVSVLGRGDL